LPSLATWIHNTEIRTVAEALQNGMRSSQAEAVRLNRQVVVTFTNDSDPRLNPTPVAGGIKWAAQTVASPYDQPISNTPVFLGAGVFTSVASGVGITGQGGSYPAICFNANGRLIGPVSGVTATSSCTISSGTTSPVTLQASMSTDAQSRPLNVTVSLGGQVRMCDPNRPALSTATPDGC
jgi:type IV fimbrial biogenesis protein FimT